MSLPGTEGANENRVQVHGLPIGVGPVASFRWAVEGTLVIGAVLAGYLGGGSAGLEAIKVWEVCRGAGSAQCRTAQ